MLFIFILFSIQYSFSQAEAINLGQTEFALSFCPKPKYLDPEKPSGITEEPSWSGNPATTYTSGVADYLSYVDQSTVLFGFIISPVNNEISSAN
ncbi:MAG: hypothetical protein IPH45_19480 [Bacteroidales bacterium]|nr:hypothetical protein [Bacteroidales bacterium]